MNTRIHITQEESELVELLYARFTSYCNILGYLTQYGSLDTTLFDKKWEEAVNLDIELSKAKQEIDTKYHPDGKWDRFEFDFKNCDIIYYNDTSIS